KKKGYLIIGSVGLLVYRKGFSQLIELLKSNCDIALVIIGEGPERNNLETLAKKNNVLDRIWLPGFRNDSYSYYKYFDIYAHVSYSEGFGLAMLEALSHKIPLICSRLDIYREYFTDEDVSYFEAGNVCALNKALYIIRNKLPFYSKKSYDLFLKYFSDEAMAKKHKEYYESIISDNKKFLLE
ncbi:MAG TPA: hypothetical protein DD434_10800, partial [Bacteroidales bacterium]|nr:hypothetical protein [Bacteroidales bacterium]